MKILTNIKATRIIAFILLLPFLVLSIASSETYQNIGIGCGALAVGIIVLSMLSLILNRKYDSAFKQFIYILINGIVFVFLTSILITCNTMVDGDHWADNLELPANVKLEPVLDDYKDALSIDSIRKSSQQEVDFFLLTAEQPGIYSCDVWYNGNKGDVLFLKAFEITQEERLSAKSITERSQFTCEQKTDKVTLFKNASHFTIYEGDWGKYYGARIELWLMRDGIETLLKSKDYKVEGWMH